jgi:hypothetical protein
MKRVTLLLRLWVFVGALLLLVSNPRGPWARSAATQDALTPMGEKGDCIQPARNPNAQCPSGCTGSTFVQYTAQGGTNGTFYLEDNGTAPCGTAKQGETCNPPLQWFPVGDFDDCCAHLGLDCTGVGNQYMNCCDSPAQCLSGRCCLANGLACSGNDAYCCSGYCYNGTCCPSTCPTPYCADISAFCSAACSDSGDYSDCYNTCYSEMYSGCEGACESCGICCP